MLVGLWSQAFNQDISEWDVSSVITMYNMFRDASNFNQDLCDWGSKIANTNPDTTLMFKFSGCTNTQDPSFAQTVISPLCSVCATRRQLKDYPETASTAVASSINVSPKVNQDFEAPYETNTTYTAAATTNVRVPEDYGELPQENFLGKNVIEQRRRAQASQTAEIAGIGSASLAYHLDRRSRNLQKDDKRELQTTDGIPANPPPIDYSITITVVTNGDDYYRIKTDGGSNVWPSFSRTLWFVAATAALGLFLAEVS